MARALDERDDAMTRRARRLAEKAIDRGQPWARQLGGPPADPRLLGTWLEAVATVTAYRERWGVPDRRRPFGDELPAANLEQAQHRSRSIDACRRARAVSINGTAAPRFSVPAARHAVGVDTSGGVEL